ncbi:MAG: hypothetical protein Q7U10_03085 [Thermodesulfovibrionia bacterium]|nr:hypothetical protein [Thermodesulfovibrionia bacterium]
MKKDLLERYSRTADGKVIIDITTERIEDLYNYFDKNAPYLKKDLDQEFVDYLIDSVHEIGKEDFVIRFRFSAMTDDTNTSRVQMSIRNYFLHQKELEVRELKRMTRKALTLFSIGVVILTLSVLVNQELAIDETVVSRLFAEGLTIAAWISLWEALATFLLNWAPHRNKIKLFERISKAPVFF